MLAAALFHMDKHGDISVTGHGIFCFILLYLAFAAAVCIIVWNIEHYCKKED